MLIGIKIKQLLLGATLLVTNSVYSITNLECTTEIPTTTAIVNQSNNQVWLQFIHHNGAHLAPIHNGIITMNDLPYDVSQAFMRGHHTMHQKVPR